MQPHQLKRNHPNKKPRIVGRGGKHAKTSGRGTKGQNARAGHKKRPEIRDFIKRIPKLRGRGKNLNTSIQSKPTIFSLGDLNIMFKSGDVVNPKTLNIRGKVKILAGGNLDKKLVISGIKLSKSAKEVIEKAGGTVSRDILDTSL